MFVHDHLYYKQKIYSNPTLNKCLSNLLLFWIFLQEPPSLSLVFMRLSLLSQPPRNYQTSYDYTCNVNLVMAVSLDNCIKWVAMLSSTVLTFGLNLWLSIFEAFNVVLRIYGNTYRSISLNSWLVLQPISRESPFHCGWGSQ